MSPDLAGSEGAGFIEESSRAPPVYLDYNGTTPIDEEVVAAMNPYFSKFWGNPSSSHYYGLEAKRGMQYAREKVASLIGAADPSEIVFMGNGTETINHTFFGCFRNHGRRGHVITQQTEHVAVLETCKGLEELGCRVTYLPVNNEGLVDPVAVETCLKQNPDTFLVSIMHSNNETGCLQRVGEIGDTVRRCNAARILDMLRILQTALEMSAPASDELRSLWKRAGNPEPAELSQKAQSRSTSPERRPFYLLEEGKFGTPVFLSGEEKVDVTRVPRQEKTFSHCFFHVDASQSLGKVDVNVQHLKIDYLTVAGHKLYAPKGVGALYINGESVDAAAMVSTLLEQMEVSSNESSLLADIRKNLLGLLDRSLVSESTTNDSAPVLGRIHFVNPVTTLPHFLRGAGQESGLRASTENVPYCVALGKACELAAQNLRSAENGTLGFCGKLFKLRTIFEHCLSEAGRKGEIYVKVNAGEPATGTEQADDPPRICRLPNTCSVSFYQVEANTLLSELHDDIAASAGAACHSDTVDISHVLQAMRVPPAWAMGTVRFSVGRWSKPDEVLAAAQKVVLAVKRLQTNVVAPSTQQQVLSSGGDRGALISGGEQVVGDQLSGGGRGSEKTTPGVFGEGAPLVGGPPTSSVEAVDKATDSLSDEVKSVKLTQFTHGMGCACKLRPQALERVLANLRSHSFPDPRVLVGLNASSDDACVYQIPNSEGCLIGTLDFFTPVVDDAFEFGEIAAANALSDVYAMGGQPLFALNIVGFPSGRLPEGVLTRILDGGRSKCTEAGVAICGGHSVEDLEPKYGLSVTGFVENFSRIWKNNTGQPGDLLFLTKKIGTGILSTALKRGALKNPTTKLALVDNMRTLNNLPVERARELERENKLKVTAATDVTGFGLLGHLREMLVSDEEDERPPSSSSKEIDAGRDPRPNGGSCTDGSCAAAPPGSSASVKQLSYRIGAEVAFSKVPLLPETEAFAQQGFVPGGTENNLANLQGVVSSRNVPKKKLTLLADATTSGGLLMTIRVLEGGNDLAKSVAEIEKELGAKCIGKLVELEQLDDPQKVIRVVQ